VTTVLSHCRAKSTRVHWVLESRPNLDDAASYERRGYFGPDFLFCHYMAASQFDRDAMARTGTPLSSATLSEMRLGHDGDPRRAFLNMRAAGVLISLSSVAALISAALRRLNRLQSRRQSDMIPLPRPRLSPPERRRDTFHDELDRAKDMGMGRVDRMDLEDEIGHAIERAVGAQGRDHIAGCSDMHVERRDELGKRSAQGDKSDLDEMIDDPT
jgi:hypothetical protein